MGKNLVNLKGHHISEFGMIRLNRSLDEPYKHQINIINNSDAVVEIKVYHSAEHHITQFMSQHIRKGESKLYNHIIFFDPKKIQTPIFRIRTFHNNKFLEELSYYSNEIHDHKTDFLVSEITFEHHYVQNILKEIAIKEKKRIKTNNTHNGNTISSNQAPPQYASYSDNSRSFIKENLKPFFELLGISIFLIVQYTSKSAVEFFSHVSKETIPEVYNHWVVQGVSLFGSFLLNNLSELNSKIIAPCARFSITLAYNGLTQCIIPFILALSQVFVQETYRAVKLFGYLAVYFLFEIMPKLTTDVIFPGVSLIFICLLDILSELYSQVISPGVRSAAWLLNLSIVHLVIPSIQYGAQQSQVCIQWFCEIIKDQYSEYSQRRHEVELTAVDISQIITDASDSMPAQNRSKNNKSMIGNEGINANTMPSAEATGLNTNPVEPTATGVNSANDAEAREALEHQRYSVWTQRSNHVAGQMLNDLMAANRPRDNVRSRNQRRYAQC